MTNTERDVVNYLRQMYDLWDQEMEAWKEGDNMYHYCKGSRDMTESVLKQFGIIIHPDFRQTLDT